MEDVLATSTSREADAVPEPKPEGAWFGVTAGNQAVRTADVRAESCVESQSSPRLSRERVVHWFTVSPSPRMMVMPSTMRCSP